MTDLRMEGLDTLSPIERNQAKLIEIIGERKAPYLEAIASGDGSEIHHAAEIAVLDDMQYRLNYLIAYAYQVEEPIDDQFLTDVMDYLRATDYSSGLWPDQPILRAPEQAAIDEALEALRSRNSALQEAA